MSRSKPRALIVGASCAIGLLYADRLARRGYDLVLLACAPARPNDLATILRRETSADVNVHAVDPSTERGLAHIETLLAGKERFDLVVNNVGMPAGAMLVDEQPERLDRLLNMNVRAFARLSAAAAKHMAKRGEGAIVNLASAIGLAPGLATGAQGAGKAFAIALTRTMQAELTEPGVHVQLVLTAATRTDIWPFPICEPELLPGMMTAADLVDAALIGLDRREAITIPSLEDTGRWSCHDRAQRALLSALLSGEPARRYRD